MLKKHKWPRDAEICRKMIVLWLIWLTIALETVAENAGELHSSAGRTRTRKLFDWTFGESATKTYLFTNCHWWESTDHQMTTIITLLAIAHNTSSVAVIPSMAAAGSQGRSNESLIGDYFDIERVRKVQPVLTMAQLVQSTDYRLLCREKTGTIPLPKESQEEYEAKLQVYGRLHTSVVQLNMPRTDPENTNQPCDRFGGTMYLSRDGQRRFVFLDRLHFLHFCAEKFMPWWYDVRQHIRPRRPYFDIAQRFLNTNLTRPLIVTHINDVMEAQKNQSNNNVEQYADQIVDALRSNDMINGAIYNIYVKSGRNVRRVVDLLQAEMEFTYDCSHMFSCLDSARPNYISEYMTAEQFDHIFRGQHALKMTEWALATQADLFIGSIHSPFSRNICLYRKLHGEPYVILKGFGELRKTWAWNL